MRAPYPHSGKADRLPTSLMDALLAFQADPVFAQKLGKDFADYMVALKTSEVDRYLQAVTDWEQKEYFELF